VGDRQGNQGFFSGTQGAFLKHLSVVLKKLVAKFFAPFCNISEFSKICWIVIGVRHVFLDLMFLFKHTTNIGNGLGRKYMRMITPSDPKFYLGCYSIALQQIIWLTNKKSGKCRSFPDLKINFLKTF
jgi:hypothetical protein